jgi:DegV family protein with EDD domain
MARVLVITDSSACLHPSVAGDPLLQVLPISIHVPTRDLRDDDPDAAGTVYEELERGQAVKSSAPSPLDYLAVAEEAEAGVVIITPATEFTVMYRHAQAAAKVARVPVAVVDSRTAAAAQGLVVLAACEAAARDGPLEDVVTAAETAARGAELVAALDGLETLRRSGHVQSVLLDVSDGMGLVPVFRLHAGAIQQLDLVQSRKGALHRIRSEVETLGWTPAARSMVFHAFAREQADLLSGLLGGIDHVTEFSPSMGIHTGPGVVGVAWLGHA